MILCMSNTSSDPGETVSAILSPRQCRSNVSFVSCFASEIYVVWLQAKLTDVTTDDSISTHVVSAIQV